MTHAPAIPVSEYMSKPLLFARKNESIHSAYARMRDNAVRQLPVLDHGVPVGLLFQRDLMLFEHLPARTAKTIPVGAIMANEFYTVGPRAAADIVARAMSEQKYAVAMVVEDGHAVGVFTTTDALKALSDSLTDLVSGAILRH